jgi:hypothetical protein
MIKEEIRKTTMKKEGLTEPYFNGRTISDLRHIFKERQATAF